MFFLVKFNNGYFQIFCSSDLGTYAFLCSAAGILLAGIVLTVTKPSARTMIAWNIVAGVVTVAGMVAYIFIGCPDNERSNLRYILY